MLYLIRHAMPDFTPEVPADRWELTADGHAAAVRLCRILPEDALLVASTEVKAVQTLAPAGQVGEDARFCEIRRTEQWGGDLKGRRRAYVEGAEYPGWEPQPVAASRFDEGIEAALEMAAGRRLVVATHGMVLSVWLAARIGLARPGEFWSGLRFPDLIEVDLVAGWARQLT